MSLKPYKRDFIITIGAVVAAVFFVLWVGQAFAGGSGCYRCTINNITEVTENNMTLNSGIDRAEFTRGMTSAMAAGGHELDYATTDYQLSITSAFALSDENENNASFKLGKRFESVDALFHVTYTPVGSEDYIIIGGTIRF